MQSSRKVLGNQRFCQYCNEVRTYHRFDKHQETCRLNATIRNTLCTLALNPDDRAEQSSVDPSSLPHVSEKAARPAPDQNTQSNSVGIVDDVHMSDNVAPSTPASVIMSSGLPDDYIEIQHHPHSQTHQPTIVPLDGKQLPGSHIAKPSLLRHIPDPKRPWAPFRTREDFEFSEATVNGNIDQKTTNTMLDGIHGKWATNHSLTVRTFADVRASLDNARKFIQQFTETEVSHIFQGKTQTFKFLYRDPWQWVKNIIQDPTLSEDISWFPVKKFLHTDGKVTRIYDELNSGDTWWEYQDSINVDSEHPHCYFPLHIWLDKSNVSSNKKMHPIILRAGALPSQIRNASGNGGGILIGYMPIVGGPADSPDNEDDSFSSVELAQYKREVYHKILGVILESLRTRSSLGEEIMCGDNIIRVIFPGFLIASLDLEEAYSLCGTRGCRANFPCPRCLVEQTELHSIISTYKERTDTDMVRIFNEARSLQSKAATELLLKDSGLHLVKNCFWKFCRSSPYHAYSYDILHSFDSGEWGKHQWPLLLKILNPGEQVHLTRNMAQVPRWAKLKHFDNASRKDFTDGNSFRDILKCIIPCLVPILPAKCPLFLAIRWCAILRGVIGLKVITEDHILYLERTVLPKYHKLCMDVSAKYGKSYDYPKHHMLQHSLADLRRKGCIDNYSTRPGEGFQQEVKQAYRRTNYKNVESQMVRTDEDHEAVAQIRMFIDQFEVERKQREGDLHAPDDPDDESHRKKDSQKEVNIDKWYSLGSESKAMRLFEVERNYSQDPNFSCFASNLLEFLAENVPVVLRPSSKDDITIRPFKCLYIAYQSMEDWRLSKDILRCNPQFHGAPRFDFVAISTVPISFARLLFIFTCVDSTGRQCDIALVQTLVPLVLKSIRWEGMQAFEEKSIQFICLEEVIRGCHFIPFFSQNKKIHFLNDLVDNDAFVRFFLDSR